MATGYINAPNNDPYVCKDYKKKSQGDSFSDVKGFQTAFMHAGGKRVHGKMYEEGVMGCSHNAKSGTNIGVKY